MTNHDQNAHGDHGSQANVCTMCKGTHAKGHPCGCTCGACKAK